MGSQGFSINNASRISKIKLFFKFFNLAEKKPRSDFHKTIYNCGDMVSIILVQKHIKKWIKNIRNRLKLKFKFINFSVLTYIFRDGQLSSQIKNYESGKKNNIDDIFNLTQAMLKKNKVLLDPLHSESITSRETETNRNLIKKN